MVASYCDFILQFNKELTTKHKTFLSLNISKSGPLSVHPLPAPAAVPPSPVSVSPSTPTSSSTSSTSESIPPVSSEPSSSVVHSVHATRGWSHCNVDVVSNNKLAVLESLGVIGTLEIRILTSSGFITLILKTYLLARYGCADISGLTPGVLSEVRVDQGEVEVSSASSGLRIDLLHQALQLLESCVHPGVHLELVGRGVAW